jgi:hypothetical protein
VTHVTPDVTSVTGSSVMRDTFRCAGSDEDADVGRSDPQGSGEVSQVAEKKITPKAAEDSKKTEQAATRVTKKRSLRRKAKKLHKV